MLQLMAASCASCFVFKYNRPSPRRSETGGGKREKHAPNREISRSSEREVVGESLRMHKKRLWIYGAVFVVGYDASINLA